MSETRIDLWLKYACLYKHRAEATEACKGGRVKVNGNRVKPSAAARISDVVEITDPRYRKVVILEVPTKQASKDDARTMYRDETPPDETAVHRDLVVRDRGAGRPSKKERREFSKLKRDW